MKRAFKVGLPFMSLVVPSFIGDAGWAQVVEPPPPPGAPRTQGGPSTGAPSGATAPSPAPLPPPGATPECFPACREGYICHQRQCISLCNPPCPSGQVCVGGQRCEFASPAYSGPIREPPLPPPAKPWEDRGFFMLGFHYGFSGEDEIEFGPGTSSSPLASTFGFNLRGDVPIERYLVLGPLFQFGAWRADLPSPPSRSYYVDADLYIRGRLPISAKSTNFQLWIGVPIGLTFHMLGPEFPTVSGAGLGWNVGFLGGGAVHFTPKFGLFAEVGWVQHKVTHDAEPDNYYIRIAQWILNVGFVFRE